MCQCRIYFSFVFLPFFSRLLIYLFVLETTLRFLPSSFDGRSTPANRLNAALAIAVDEMKATQSQKKIITHTKKKGENSKWASSVHCARTREKNPVLPTLAVPFPSIHQNLEVTHRPNISCLSLSLSFKTKKKKLKRGQ